MESVCFHPPGAQVIPMSSTLGTGTRRGQSSVSSVTIPFPGKPQFSDKQSKSVVCQLAKSTENKKQGTGIQGLAKPIWPRKKSAW